MSFYNMPKPYNPGFAIPQYVQAEPPGRGTFTTRWLPRGTISQVVPDYLTQPGPKVAITSGGGGGSLSGTVFDESALCSHVLQGDTLGARSRCGKPRRCRRGGRVFTLEGLGDDGANPVTEYGRRAAAWIMKTINRVPEAERKAALRALLDGIDPTLWPKVDQKGTAYQSSGMAPKAALERAMAEAMSDGIAKEIVDVGKRVLRGERLPVKKRSQMGLGVYPEACFEAHCRSLEALGWNPISAVKKAAKAVGGAVASAGRAVARGASTVGSAVRTTAGAVAALPGNIVKGAKNAAGEVWDGAKWVADKVGSGVEKAAEWVGDAVEKLGDLACSLANSPVGAVAAGAGAAAVGAPPQVGMAGAQAVSAMCASGAAAPEAPPAPAPSSLPGWVLPAGIGAAGLVAFLALRKKR